MTAKPLAQVFQRIWSGRVTNERKAWELLSLLDQIHLWAITEFRTFIIDHLEPWHKFCDKNYLLDWDSVYDSGEQRKRMRTCDDIRDFALPSWTKHLSATNRQKVKVRATKSFLKVQTEQRRRKGKSICQNEDYIVCTMGACSGQPETRFCAEEAWLDHLRLEHEFSERELVPLKLCLDQGLTAEKEKEEDNDREQDQEEKRLSSDITASVTDDNPGPSKRVRRC